MVPCRSLPFILHSLARAPFLESPFLRKSEEFRRNYVSGLLEEMYFHTIDRNLNFPFLHL